MKKHAIFLQSAPDGLLRGLCQFVAVEFACSVYAKDWFYENLAVAAVLAVASCIPFVLLARKQHENKALLSCWAWGAAWFLLTALGIFVFRMTVQWHLFPFYDNGLAMGLMIVYVVGIFVALSAAIRLVALFALMARNQRIRKNAAEENA